MSDATSTRAHAREDIRKIELLHATGLALAAEKDLKRIVQVATDAARELCGAEFGAFFYNVINAYGESYMLYTLSGVPEEAFSRFPMPRNTGVFAPTFNGEGIVRSDDITADPRYGQNAPYHGMPPGHLPVRSYLAVPVIARDGEVLGGLFFGHSKPGMFLPEGEQFVHSIAGQAAIALENARLHDKLNQKIREERVQFARVREVLESTTDSVVLLDRKWTVTYVNRRAVEMIAGGRELLGLNLWEAFPEAVGTTFWHSYQRSMAERQSVEFVEYFPPLNKWFEVHANPTEEGIAVFFHDVTEKRSAADALARSEERLRLAVLAGDVGTWIWNAESDLVDLDDRAAQIFGWTPHRPVSWSDMQHRMLFPEDAARAARRVQDAIATRSTYFAEYRTHHQERGMRWVAAFGQPVFGNEGEVVRMVGTVQDITERKHQEELLRQTEKLAAAGRLAATVAHEINNPLEAATNLLFIAMATPGLDRSVKQLLTAADDELRRVAHLARQTLGFYRDSQPPKLFVVRERLQTISRVFSAKLRNSGVKLMIEATACQVWATPNEFDQIFTNLIANAIDASSSGGAIVIRCKPCLMTDGDRGVQVTVFDNGHGISREHLLRLFEPFFTTKASVGTGLGLWVTKTLVQKGGGSIRVHTRNEGDRRGTAFSVFLPVREREPAESAA